VCAVGSYKTRFEHSNLQFWDCQISTRIQPESLIRLQNSVSRWKSERSWGEQSRGEFEFRI
jgi:hypothetical protein